MSCLNPMIRIPVDPLIPLDKSGTFAHLTFTNEKAAHLTGNWKVHNDGVVLPRYVTPLEYLFQIQENYPKAQPIPCGKCEACILLRRSIWTQRILAHAKSYPDTSFFCTFTYDPAYVHTGIKGYQKEGEPDYLDDVLTFDIADFQAMKKRIQSDIRYIFRDLPPEERPKLSFFACAEYGEVTLRPHFHCIFFGLPLTFFCTKSEIKHHGAFKRSAYLSKKWGRGFVSIARMNDAMAQYVAGYVLKKVGTNHYRQSIDQYYTAIFCEWLDTLDDKKAWMDGIGLDGDPEDYFESPTVPLEEYRGKLRAKVPEGYVQDEKRWSTPGIGKEWYDAHKAEILRIDAEGHFSDKAVGLFKWPVKPAPYFDSMLDRTDNAKLVLLKAQRKRETEARLRLKLNSGQTIHEITQQNYNTVMAKFSRKKLRDNLQKTF